MFILKIDIFRCLQMIAFKKMNISFLLQIKNFKIFAKILLIN